MPVTRLASLLALAALMGTACAIHKPLQLAARGSMFVSPRGPDSPPPRAKTVKRAVKDAFSEELVCEPGDMPGQFECRPAGPEEILPE